MCLGRRLLVKRSSLVDVSRKKVVVDEKRVGGFV